MSKIMRQIYAEARAAREAAATPPAGKREAATEKPTLRADLTARILQRHLQFGRRCRLDLEALSVCVDRLRKR